MLPPTLHRALRGKLVDIEFREEWVRIEDIDRLTRERRALQLMQRSGGNRLVRRNTRGRKWRDHTRCEQNGQPHWRSSAHGSILARL